MPKRIQWLSPPDYQVTKFIALLKKALLRVTWSNEQTESLFTTSADGQELDAQLDASYRPISFAFGNVVTTITNGFYIFPTQTLELAPSVDGA